MKKYDIMILILSLGALLLFGNSFAGTALPMDAFLSQVASDNREIRAAREASEGAGLRTAESTLIYSPIFSAEFQRINDTKTNSLFPSAYDKLYSDLYILGISQLTSFGLKAKLSYTLSSYDYVQTPDRPKFYEGLPRIELSQSLLRNGFGSETRAQKELSEAGAIAAQYSQSFQAKAIRAEAESAYIKLAAARDLRKISEDSAKFAREILDWNTRRVRLNLGEDSDLLQAQANMEGRNLQLQSAIDAERTAARDFNRLRNIDHDEVSEQLALPSVNGEIPARAQFRDDVRAAIENTRIASAQARLGKERNRATLEVFGSYALNSRDGERSKAISDSLKTTFPTSLFGVRFETPILVGAKSDAVKGYSKEAVAAETLKDQKLFNQEIQWKDLVLRLDEARKRYEISLKLADVQKRKAISERARLKRGRTTTYQTLLFDTDLNQAEATKIQSQSEVLLIIAQMKTFGGA